MADHSQRFASGTARWLVALALLGLIIAETSGCAPYGRRRGGKRAPLPIPVRTQALDPRTDEPPPVLDTATAPVASSPGSLRVPTAQGRGWKVLTWEKASESVGRPNDGALLGARALPPEGPGWTCASERVFGTDESLLMLSWAFAEVQRRYPGSVPVVVGDISVDGGGKLKPHRSHQSGRDADVGYFAVGNRALRRFEAADASTLDAEKTWALLEFLLLTGEVQFIFIDNSLQPLLYQAAMGQGWSTQTLDALFQYRLPNGSRQGVVRHTSGHRDHFHVRFRCPAGDERCEL